MIPDRGRRSRTDGRLDNLVGGRLAVVFDQTPQDVLAGRVHEIEQQDEQRDQPDVLVPEEHVEAEALLLLAAFAPLRLGG